MILNSILMRDYMSVKSHGKKNVSICKGLGID